MILKRVFLPLLALALLVLPGVAQAQIDLTVSKVTGFPAVAPVANAPITLNVCVKNQGTARAGTFKVMLQYSSNDIISSSDPKIAEFTIAAMSGGVEICRNVVGTMPSTTSSTGFYGVRVDFENKVTETDTGNNSWAASLTPKPDLMVVLVQGVPASATSGQRIVLPRVCVQNRGSGGFTTAYKVAIYHSTSSFISPPSSSLTLLTSFTPALPPAALTAGTTSCTFNVGFNLPAGLKSGNNYVAAFVDYEKKVAESTENNNYLAQKFSLPGPDSIISTVTGVPATATGGLAYTIKVTVKNNGSLVATAPFAVELRISKNTTYTASDLLLGTAQNVTTNLAAGASTTLTFTGNFPSVNTGSSSNFSAGDNYLFAWVDQPAKVTETDETNNIKETKFTVPAPKLADLTVTKITGLPATAPLGSAVKATICVKNTGDVDVATTTVGLYLSNNSFISSSDNRVGSANAANVKAGGAEVCVVVNGTVSGSQARVGDLWWGAIVDYDAKVPEKSNTNNDDFTPIKFTATASTTKFDLEVVSISGAPASSAPGATISNIIVCIRNNGPDDIKTAFKTGLYYSSSSTQTTFPSATNLIAEFSLTGLVKTTPSCKTLSGTIPTGASFGARFLGVFTDSGKTVLETNENNNTKTTPITLDGPDLVVTNIKGMPTTTPKAGDTLTLEICVKNIGKGASAASSTGVYYSTNNIISTGDTRITTFATGTLTAGQEICTKNVAVKLPTSATATGFVGGLADWDSKISESDNFNNDYAVPLTAAADLLVEAIKGVPKTAKAGDSITVEVCLKNAGALDAGPFKTGVSHSTSSFLSTTTPVLVEQTWTGLKAGVSACQKSTVKLPSNLTVGNNYIGAYADRGTAIKESNESNNYDTVAFAIPGPDLVIDSIKGVPTTATPGSAYSVDVCVKNTGSDPAKAPVKLGIFVSSNTIYTTSDDKLGEFTFTNDIAGGATVCHKFTGNFPTTLTFNFAVGPINFSSIVDFDSKVAELDDSNNDKGVAFTVVVADLTVSKVTGFPAKAKVGDTITANVCVKNDAAGADAGPFKVGIYLSSNNKIETTDTLIAETAVASLAKGKETCVSVSGKLPASAVPGAGFFGAYADSGTNIGEKSETNNGSTGVATTIERSGTVDLVVDTVTGVPATATATQNMNVKVCVKNKGTGASGAFKVGVFYSKDANISVILDTKLKDAGIANILAGKTECVTMLAVLPATINGPKGADNWVGIVADFEQKTGEASATFADNIKAIKFTNSGGFPDLVIDSIKGVPATATPGAALNLDVCVKNNGPGDASPPIDLRILIGGSSFPSTFDLKIADYVFTKAIAAGKTECAKIATKFPTTVSSSSFGDFKIGDNWVYAWVDIDNKIKEGSESNNNKGEKFTLPGPDLEIDSYTGIPAKIKPGDTFKLTVCVKNSGTGDAPKFKVGFYYSTNNIISTGDTLLIDIPFPNGVVKGKTECVKDVVVTWKQCLAVGGTGYWAPYANYDGAFGEISTSNNYPASAAVKSFTIDTYDQSNLTIKELSGIPASPAKIKLGAELTLKVCVENTGKGDAAAFKVGIWYSSDSSLSSFSDSLMDTIEFKAGAKAAATVCITQKVKVTSAVKAGAGFIGAWVNQPVEVCESSTTDNTKTAAAEFDKFDQPDLFNSKVTLTNDYLAPGDSFTASFCIQNKGKGDSVGNFKASVMVSTNDFISISDSDVGSITFGDIKAGATQCKSFTGKVPTGTLFVSGGWIGLMVDSDGQINESDETNNDGPASDGIISARFNPPGPDLSVEELTLTPANGAPGTAVKAKFCVQNKGTTDILKGFKVTLYFSSDNFFSATADTKLTEYEYKVADLAKFKKGAVADCQTVNVTIPSGTTAQPGTRYIFAFVDADDVTADANTGNDGRIAPFFVPSATQPNLVIVSVKLTSNTVTAGDKAEVETCIGNYGTAIPAATKFKVALYIDAYNATGKIFEYKEIAGFKANDKVCYKELVTIPATLTAGAHLLAGWADFENKVTNEVTETDNQGFAVTLTVVKDEDKDGVPSDVDCNDNDKNVFPAYKGKPAAKEVCDDQDNNCDKQIDEGFTDKGKECKAGSGACEDTGKQVCKADGTGVECSTKGLTPGTETCNGKDDDCNGKVDDGTNLCKVGEACNAGKCELQKCVTNGDCPTGSVCKAGECGAPTKCTKDDECNQDAGETCDNGACKPKACTANADCPKDNLCLGSVCVLACTKDADCGTGFTCSNGRCWKGCTKDDECFNTQKCVEGTCQESACTTACPKGERCMGGKCVEDNCYGYVCPNAQICQVDKCAADPCFDKKCAAGEFCRAGNCIKSCNGVSCSSGEFCVDGKCEKNDCEGVTCDPGKVCLNGTCVNDDCANVTCKDKRYCNPAGNCVDDPCATVTCPTDEICKVRKNQAQCDPKNAPPQEVTPEVTPEVAPEVAPEQATEAVAEATPEADAGTTTEAASEQPQEAVSEGSKSDGGDNTETTTDGQAQGGCNCSAGQTPFSGMLLLLVGFLGLVMRRRYNKVA